MKDDYNDGNVTKYEYGTHYGNEEFAMECDYSDGFIIQNVTGIHYNHVEVAVKCDYFDGNVIEYYENRSRLGTKGKTLVSSILESRDRSRNADEKKDWGAPNFSRLQQSTNHFEKYFNESTWEAKWITRSAGGLLLCQSCCMYDIVQLDFLEGAAVFIAVIMGIFLLCAPALLVWMLPYMISIFNIRDSCCRRKLVKIQKKRTMIKVYERKVKGHFERGVFAYLLVFTDLHACLGVECVAPRTGLRDAQRDGQGKYEFHDNFGKYDSEAFCYMENDTDAQEGITLSDTFPWSSSWNENDSHERLRQQRQEQDFQQTRMRLIDLIRQETQRIRQVTEATTPVHGAEQIESEVTNLRIRNQNGAVLLTMHALRFTHLATRTQLFQIRPQIQEGEFMIDLYTRIRFHWRDQLRENELLRIYYIHRQPYALDEDGQEALHLLLDMNSEQGGVPELMVITRFYGEQGASSPIYMTHRNYVPWRRCHDMLEDAGLTILCEGAHNRCECSTTALDYMLPDERFDSYWGACIFLDVKIHENAEEGDHIRIVKRNDESTSEICARDEPQEQQRESDNEDAQEMANSRPSTSQRNGSESEESSSQYESDEEMTLLQTASRLQPQQNRTSFARHAYERIPPPGNGKKQKNWHATKEIRFNEMVNYQERDGTTYACRDRNINDDRVLHAWNQLKNDQGNQFTQGYMRGLRYGQEEELCPLPLLKLPEREHTLDEEEEGHQGDYHLPIQSEEQSEEKSDLQEKRETPKVLSLEKCLDLEDHDANNIDELVKALRKDPSAKYPLRQDWEKVRELHPTVKNVLAAQENMVFGKIVRLHIFLDGSSSLSKGQKRAAWSFVVGVESDCVDGPNCKIVGFHGAPLASTSLSSYYIGESTLDSGEAECAAMFWAGI